MVIRRRSSKISSKYALRIWLLAIVSSVVLTAGVVEVSTRTVQADVLPSREIEQEKLDILDGK